MRWSVAGNRASSFEGMIMEADEPLEVLAVGGETPAVAQCAWHAEQQHGGSEGGGGIRSADQLGEAEPCMPSPPFGGPLWSVVPCIATCVCSCRIVQPCMLYILIRYTYSHSYGSPASYTFAERSKNVENIRVIGVRGLGTRPETLRMCATRISPLYGGTPS